MKKKKSKKNPDFKKAGFKSPLELEHSLQLKKLAKAYKAQVGYETTKLPYILKRKYNPDFTCVRADGSVFYIEIKGYFRMEDRNKIRACVECDPRPDIRMVFARDNTLSSKSNMKYSDWCAKYSIPCAVGTIPEEWFI